MESITPTMHIAIHEARQAIRLGDSLVDQLKAAMQITREHWLVTDEEQSFKCAVAAVMLHYGQESDEYKQLAWEVRQMGRVSAMLHAVQAGLSVDLEGLIEKGEYEPIGLLALWKERI